LIQANPPVAMSDQVGEFFSRLASFCRRHGIIGAVEEARVRAHRALFQNWKILFYCDLQGQAVCGKPPELPSGAAIERKSRSSEMSEKDWQAIFKIWDPRLSRRAFAQRFARGATMWLVRTGEEIAGYGWTLRGGTIQPDYYQLGEKDVHLFDFMVLPEFRRQGINCMLVNHIAQALAAEGRARAYIETYEWNHSMLKSLERTNFRACGKAHKRFLQGHTVVTWSDPPTWVGTGAPFRERSSAIGGKCGAK